MGPQPPVPADIPAPLERLRPLCEGRPKASRPPGQGPRLGTRPQGCKASCAGLSCGENGSKAQVCSGLLGLGSESEGHCFRRKAHLAQCNGAGGQADEAPLPAVGVLRQGKLLRQGLDHMLDLHGVVLGHELPDQPGETGERGCRAVRSGSPPRPAAGSRAGDVAGR